MHAAGRACCVLFSSHHSISHSRFKSTKEHFPGWEAVFSSIQLCTRLKDLSASKQVQCVLVCYGLDSVSFCADHLIRLFTLCGSLPDAQHAFYRVCTPSLYTWNAILSAHVTLGTTESTFALYHFLLQCCYLPDRVMLLSLFKACNDWRRYMMLHHHIVSYGLESDVRLASTLVDFNVKTGALREAYKLFQGIQNRDAVSWAALMSGYIQHGFSLSALDLFEEMKLDGIHPDRVVFLCILKACSQVGAIVLGRRIHNEVVRSGLENEIAVGNILIDMYAKCGSVEEADKILTGLHKRDVVSWNALITGYAQHGYEAAVLKNFKTMQEEGIKPSKVTYLSVLKACISLVMLAQGWLIHEGVLRSGLDSDLEVGNSLVDLYAKCGVPNEAQRVFMHLPKRDIVSWGALLAGYAQVGSYEVVLNFLRDMKSQSLLPNDAIFMSMLAACGRSGRLEEAKCYFKVMLEDYGITPNIQHYSCLIDLFGRAGRLKEAQRFFEIIPLPPDAVAWKSLLTSCRTHGSVDMGHACFEQVVQLEAGDAPS